MKKIDPFYLLCGLMLALTVFFSSKLIAYSQENAAPLSFDEEESTIYREEGQIIVPAGPEEPQSLEEMLAERQAKEEKEAEPKVYEILDEYEQYLLAKIAMAEAEGEDEDGKALVICVVLNRVTSEEFPNDVESVIFDEDEFAPIKNGRWDRVEPNKECYDALEKVMEGWDESKGALYFESSTSESTCTAEIVHGCLTMDVTIFTDNR